MFNTSAAASEAGTVTGDGGPGRLDSSDLLPLVYDQLRELARHRMAGEPAGHTLQATALVHEAYLKMASGRGPAPWLSRAHFFHAAAEAMRRLLIDHARARRSIKRGGHCHDEPLPDERCPAAPARRVALNVLDLASAAALDPLEVLAVDEAVSELGRQDPDLAAVVRLRFFAGLSVEEAAETLGVSPRTVKRDWTFARAWLFRRLGY